MSGKGTPRVGRKSTGKLSIQLLGGVALAANGRPLPLSNRKARAMLCFLALEPQMEERRKRLAGLFWSDASESKSRTSLRQTLFDIREAMRSAGCDALTDNRESVGLDPGKLDLDLFALLNALRSGTVPDALVAAPRISESLMAGYEDISPLFDDWVLSTRQAMHNRLAASLDDLFKSEAVPRLTRYRATEAALRLDPLNETACRTLMQLSAEDGETGAALRAYDDLYRALEVEMDMEPSEQTTDLVARIKLGDFDGSGKDAPAGTEHGPQPAAAKSGLFAAVSAGGPTLAVLPFADIGPDPVPGYFAQGVVEDTVCMLSALREPVVVSHNSTRDFTHSEQSYAEIGHDLGVAYLVRGSVRQIGEDIRLTVQLIDATTSAIIWAKRYDTTEPHLFATNDNIVANIAQTLVPNLRDVELRRSRHKAPEDLSAYHLMLQARDLTFRLDRPTFEAAGALLSQAVKTDPNYAATHAAYADWFSVRIGQGWSPDPAADLRSLDAMAQLAIRLDRESGRALAMLGHNKTILAHNYDEARHLLDRAADASPNDAETLMWSSPTFAYSGDAEEAVRRAERAISLSPRDPYLFRFEHFLSIALYAAGDFEGAARWGLSSMERNPAYTSNLRMTAAALAAIGKTGETPPIVKKLLELQPGFNVSSHISRHAFKKEDQRQQFGEHLIGAGLPE